MLTLDQVRAVNDGFKSGDLNAALRPLEEAVDLRVNELPRLDKPALAALKSGLQNGEDAATWAEALFHPNISVRRFARKTFMGLGDEAEPLFVPLRERLTRFWSEVKPLPETNKAREAALRREQREMVESALELLLRSHPEEFLNFYADLMDSTPRKENNSVAIQEWHDRNSKAWEETRKETDRILEEEWGKEWLANDKRWKLPSRVLREIDERARQKPEIVQLWSELGNNPYERAALEWQPLGMLAGMMGSYLIDYSATGPTRRVAERLRPVFWQWLATAFDPSHSVEVRQKNARRLLSDSGWWTFTHWLGTDRIKAELPAMLLGAKEHLLKPIKALLNSPETLYQRREFEGEELVAQVWISLTAALGHQFNRPYNIKPKDWKLPENLEASTLRELSAGLEPSKANEHLLAGLETAAQTIEEARLAQSQETPEPQPQEATAAFPLTSQTLLSAYDVLPSDQLQAIYNAERNYEKSQAKVNAEVKRVEEEIGSIKDTDERVRLLLDPPPHPRFPNKTFSRISYWKVWVRDLGENGAQKLRDSLWEQVEPKLWEKLEERLEAYRRAETDPVEPKIEQKLTEREIKEWRAQTRRDKRAVIQQEIQDIAFLLIESGGVPARRKVIELADRPSCRDLREQYEMQLFAELERYPGDSYSSKQPSIAWEEWRLGEDWDSTLAKMEERLAEGKFNDWQRQNMERQLATGYYRRGNFAKFKHFVELSNAQPYAVACAVQFYDDFEAWRVLINGANQWGQQQLANFWKAQQSDPERKERAMRAVVETISATSDEGVAKSLLSWLDTEPVASMVPYTSMWEHSLESSLPVVRRRAMSILGALEEAEFDRQSAAQVASESLWNESGALAKDAAKFLSQLGAQDAEVAETAWELLSDATALDNLAVNEAVFRSLSQIKTKHKTLVLPDAAREKLDDLVAVQSDRFAKFQKKLV